MIVTSDKVYRNEEWEWAYRESDALGGRDPYSASKAAAEIVAASMASSFLAPRAPVITARAGNVIGGGDFAVDRLIPDIFRALQQKVPLVLRNPAAIGPGACHRSAAGLCYAGRGGRKRPRAAGVLQFRSVD